MMSKNTDYVNNLINRLAYVDMGENFEPGDNLIDAVRNSGDNDLADALEEAGYGDYIIKDYANQNDSNGFAAIAIEDPNTGDVGMSFRGTENMGDMGDAVLDIIFGNAQQRQDAINNQIDMIDNIQSAVTGDSEQVRQAQEFFQKNQSRTGNNYLYGHSKGGNLALEVYVENYDKVAGVHVINPQPVNWADLNGRQLAALRNGKVDAVVIDGDLVWMLGGVPYPVRIIQNNGTLDEEKFGPHDLASGAYDDKTGAAKMANNPYSNYMGYGLAGTAFMCIITQVQAGYELFETGMEWIGHAHRYFAEEIPEHARRFWESVQNLWGETKQKGIEVLDNVQDFFSDLEKTVEDWWSKHFGGGQTGDSGGPCQFRADPPHLRQIASQLSSVSRNLDTLEGSLGRYATSVRTLSFVGTVALSSSLLGLKMKTRSLERDVEKLSDALTEIAEIYDLTEGKIVDNAQC